MILRFIERAKGKAIDPLVSYSGLGFMDRAWAKNSAAWLAVVSSWGFFLSIYPQNAWEGIPVSLGSAVHGYSLVAMVIALGLLRRSSGRVNKVQDELLDEREISDRDWAYKTGYLVVRRTGLGVVSLLTGLWLINESLRGVPIPGDPAPMDDFSKFIGFYFQENALLASLQLLGLLTFVAYTFPLILLAWRQAKNVDVEFLNEQEVASYRDVARTMANRYFTRLKLLVGFIGLLIVVWVLLNIFSPSTGYSGPFVGGALFVFLFGVVFYGVWVYAVGMFNQAFMIRVLERVPGVEGLKPLTRTLFKQFVALSVIGSLMLTTVLCSMLSLPIFLIIASIGLPFCFLGGVVLLSIHLSSFGAIKEIGGIQSKDSQ